MYVLHVIGYGVMPIRRSVLAVRKDEPWESKICRPSLMWNVLQSFFRLGNCSGIMLEIRKEDKKHADPFSLMNTSQTFHVYSC